MSATAEYDYLFKVGRACAERRRDGSVTSLGAKNALGHSTLGWLHRSD